MNQIDLKQNQLVLKEKRGPLIARLFIYLLTIFSIILPLGGVTVNVSNSGLTIVSVIMLGLFGLIAYYMLRVSLWNTYGAEIIEFQKNKINYTADYQWFKGGQKEFDFEKIDFTIQKSGYEEDNKGVLVIKFDEKEIFETVSKLPLSDLEILRINLKELYNNQTPE
ncbi:hypothetical protein [Sphingobacterium sp. G1-14]|uniref:hypothetical protein n=1 Tax=Sphingobacterium TaxID=28453 RepID=UPI000B4941DE|nr:hypothetical protein [Sphingobacterium sp. G1-14]